MRLAVQLPEGEDLNEWLAVHGASVLCCVDHETFMHASLAVDFFNHLNMLYGTVTEFCTPQEVRFEISTDPACNSAPWVSVLSCLQALGEKLLNIPCPSLTNLKV